MINKLTIKQKAVILITALDIYATQFEVFDNITDTVVHYWDNPADLSFNACELAVFHAKANIEHLDLNKEETIELINYVLSDGIISAYASALDIEYIVSCDETKTDSSIKARYNASLTLDRAISLAQKELNHWNIRLLRTNNITL